MNRIELLNQRYSAVAEIERYGTELVAVGDPVGARFNSAVRRLVYLAHDEGTEGFLEDLIGPSKALLWTLITQPQPKYYNPYRTELSEYIGNESRKASGTINDQSLLDDLAESSALAAESESEVAQTLLRSLQEVGSDACVVVAANKRAAINIGFWLHDHNVPVVTVGEIDSACIEREQIYAIGPPRFFRPSLVTAPIISEISFIAPAWFGDRRIPRSIIADYADGAIEVKTRVFEEGDIVETDAGLVGQPENELEFLPQPEWRGATPQDREPQADEVKARKVLLSGNLSIWLDDGERIRSVDPTQPAGERVTYTDIPAVSPGTYLLLRQGETERGALYQEAITQLANGEAVHRSQLEWKQRLGKLIHTLGYGIAVKQLRELGVSAADRVRAWTEPSLIRPASDSDFTLLLQWIGVPVQPSFEHAGTLRRSLYTASAVIGKQLESAVADANMMQLESEGNLRIDAGTDGFRGVIATRVLAVSPFSTVVARHDARIPTEDRSGQWLE